jgi:hypothetical protein
VIETYDTLTDLWHKSVRRMWRGTLDNGGIDFIASIDTIAYDNLLTADSMAFDFDMGRDLWLTKHRWTVLVRQYLDESETARFIQRSADIGLGEGKRGVVTSMFCRNVAREARKHRWGNCMASFVYRGLRTDTPTLSLHSRVSYIAYIGGLDLALAAVIAREIGRRIRVPAEEFRFVWHVDALQFHGFKSLPFLYRSKYVKDLENPELREAYPTIKIVGKWWDQAVRFHEEGKPLQEEKYGPFKRIRRRYQEWQAGDYLPSVGLDNLTLDPLYRR